MTFKRNSLWFALLLVFLLMAIYDAAHAQAMSNANGGGPESTASVLSWISSIVGDLMDVSGIGLAAWFGKHLTNTWLRSAVMAGLPRAAAIAMDAIEAEVSRGNSATLASNSAIAKAVSYMNQHFQPALRVLGITPTMVESMVQAEFALMMQTKPAVAVASAAGTMADHIDAITNAATQSATNAARAAVGEAVSGALSIVAQSGNVGAALANLAQTGAKSPA